ncbi:MAG: tetratricopeptide repeat protein [Promethearchaeota archaeon]
MFHSEIIGLNSVEQLREEGKIKEALQIVEELEQGDGLSLKELLLYKLVKANLLREIGKLYDAIEIAKDIFHEFQKLGDLVSSLDALLLQAYSYIMTVNITQSEDLITQAEDLFKLIKETLSIDLRERESFLVRIKAIICGFKGDIHTSLELNKKAYELAKDTGNKALISRSLNNIAEHFYHLKDYDKAIKYAKKAFKVKDNRYLVAVLGTLIKINVSKGDIKEANFYLDHLREHLEKFDIKPYKRYYQSLKAFILKSSLRARDRIKAEDIFKELAMDNTLLNQLRIEAIINLCDLYLTELRITNDPKIINEIHPYIQKLLDIAENQHLYLYLAETYLLQAKLSLLTLDINKAKIFLTQAQTIAESYGMKRLAMKISYEHDELLRKTKMWENLKISQASISERLKLAGLNEQLRHMLKKQIIEIPEFSEEEPVFLLLLSEGGSPLFSKSFIEDKVFESHLLGGFLATIDYFIREMFSEGLDRAIFGDYTLLMKSFPPFFICYIFKGNSYYALQKLNYFIDILQTRVDIWQNLLNSFKLSKLIHLKDIPLLESLITDVFITQNMVINDL